MFHNGDKKLDALFAAARCDLPDTSDREQYFETRLMARLAERRQQTVPWHRMVWRLLPAFTAITVLCLVICVTLNSIRTSDPFAAITNGQEEQMAKNYLLGE